jgi:hypothetical protein
VNSRAKLLLVLLWLLPAPVAAEEIPSGTILEVGRPVIDARLREDFRAYVRILIERDLDARVARGLQAKGTDEAEIRRALANADFRAFKRKVSHDPRLARAIDRRLDELANAPQTARLEAEARRSEAAALELAAKEYLFKRMVTARPASPAPISLWDRLWTRVNRFLMG